MPVGVEEHLPAGFLLTTMEKLAGYARSRSTWPTLLEHARLRQPPLHHPRTALDAEKGLRLRQAGREIRLYQDRREASRGPRAESR